MTRGRAKPVPAFPAFLLPPGMNGGKAAEPLADPARAPCSPSSLVCFDLQCSVPAQAVHVGREPCAPVPGPAPNQYVLASKPTPHSGTDDPSKKNSEIFNSSVPTGFSSTRRRRNRVLSKRQTAISSCLSKGEQILLLKKGYKPRLSYNWKNINS